MVVNEEDVLNIMGGMEHAGGIRLNDHKRKLKNRFEIRRKLGQGTYGKVQLGINKETSQEVAIKTIKKSKIETEADLIRIRREIQIMSSVQHPNIIHIYEVFENKEKMVLVMEIAAGGELYDFLSERKCLEEPEARRIFRQIATAVYYCHKHNICHRDLKLENILLDENGCAKIADFGLSNVYDGKHLLSTFCGSPLYASPEIVKGNPYAGPEVDCWSLGVLLYTLVYGAMPFDGSNFKRLVKQITTGDYYEPKQPAAASDLIRTMLTVGSDKRANIADICSHWWVNDGYGENSCLQEAEYLAGLTPVRLDLLLSLAPPGSAMEDDMKKAVLVEPNEDDQQAMASEVISRDNESAMSIVELPPDTVLPDGAEDEASEVSISEPPDEKSPSTRKRKPKDPNAKRKMTETPTLLDPDLTHKKRSDQVVAPNDTRSEHSKTRRSKERSSPRTPSRNSPLTAESKSFTPTSGIDSASSKLENDSSNPRKKNRTNEGPTHVDKKTKSPTPTRANKEGRKTPVKRKKEVIETDTADKHLHPPHDQYPQISPDLQRKPPPKPKAKRSDDVGDEVEVTLRPGSSANRRRPTKEERKIRERNVRTPDPEREPRERNVITPDPVSRVDSGFEDNDSNTNFERPCPVLERPPTPREPRAPSPEERPLVVPLPPPRIPNASQLSTQTFNPAVGENTTGHQLFCADTVPPPIPERPVSMHIDSLNLQSNSSNEPSIDVLSRNTGPPPIPERPQMESMQINTQDDKNQKHVSSNSVTKSGETGEGILQNREETKTNPLDINSQKEQETNAYVVDNVTRNVETEIDKDRMCSKNINSFITDIDESEIIQNKSIQKNEEITPIIAAVVVHPVNDTSRQNSDKSKEVPIPPTVSIFDSSMEGSKSRSPKINSKNESNSKSVIISPTTQYDNSISSDSKSNGIEESYPLNEPNLLCSASSPLSSHQPNNSAPAETSLTFQGNSGVTIIDVKKDIKDFIEENKLDSKKPAETKPTSNTKTHTITLEMPKIEPKSQLEKSRHKDATKEETGEPLKKNLSMISDQNGSKGVQEPISSGRNEEKTLSLDNELKGNSSPDTRTSPSITIVEKDAIVELKNKPEEKGLTNEVEAIIKPAPPAPPKKQPEKKISIKQQLQQAALQKLQQQQARHAIRQANVEKVSTTTRPKTPQTFGKTPAVELYANESVASRKNEVTNDKVSPSSAVTLTDTVSNGQDSSESRGSSAGKQDDGKSLINSVPKPFKPDSNWNEKSEPSSPQQPPSTRNHKTGANVLRKDNTSDSVASAISLSSSGSDHSLPRQTPLPNRPVPLDEPIKRPFNNLLQSSPGGSSSSLTKANQRDSKVIKAAQYWNNFIGDIATKPKAVETVKTVEKPKKIISGGVGQKGYNDLKTAFEQKNKKEPVAPTEKFGIQRRNSKKLSIDGCQPGLRVNDALSVFESKNQPSTPVIYRRNSVKDGGQPKWSAKQKHESEPDTNNAPTSPVVILNREDIENLKQMNSNTNSPEAGKVPESLSNQLELEKITTDKVKNEMKANNKNLPNGLYDQTPNGLDNGNDSRGIKNDFHVAKSDNKQHNVDVFLNNKINESLAVPKTHTNNEESNVIHAAPNESSGKQIKQETSPKVKIKKDPTKSKENTVGLKHTSKTEPSFSSPKLKPFKRDKEHNDDNDVVSVEPPPVPSKTVSTANSTNLILKSPNKAARDSELMDAKLSAKDVIAREVFKMDMGKTSLEEGVEIVSKIKNETENYINNENSMVNKRDNINSSKVHGTKVTPSPALRHVSTDEEEIVLRHGTTVGKLEMSKDVSSLDSTGDRLPFNESSTNKAVADSKSNGQPQNTLEVMKNSLKKVPRAPTMRNTTGSEIGEEQNPTTSNNTLEQEPNFTDKLTSSVLIGSNNKQQDNTSVPPPNKSSNVTTDILKISSLPSTPSTSTVADTNLTTNNLKNDKDNDIVTTSKSTRIIPIKIERDMKKVSESQSTISDITSPKVVTKDSVREVKKEEHYIPIMVEGKGMINNAPITTQISREDQDEANEKFDSFHSNSLSRRRFGSRKKRMSSAYSDSSGISDEGSELGGGTFSGLQRFSSLGKHGLEETPVLKLRKTRPPFTMQRSDSCSSGEDDFDDDGFREMTAENLFSTLLTRVKSLTRRIHDEHETDLEKSFRQNQRILNHPLNPGGTHARLERSAQRGSIKREKPPTLSRQSSTDAATSRYSTIDDGTSSVRSYGGGSVRGENDLEGVDSTAALMRKYGSSPGGGRDDAGSSYSTQSLQRGTRASPITVLPQSSLAANNGSSHNFSRQSSHDSISSNRPPSNTKDRVRKSSKTYLPSEREMINRLYREAAERTNALAAADTFSDGYDERASIGSPEVDELSTASEREWDKMRKRSYLRRLDEDTTMPNLGRHVTRRSISRELFNDAVNDPTSPLNNPVTRITSARPVTRRSVSREFQTTDTPSAATQVGRSTPTSAFLTSPRRNVSDYSGSIGRSSRERSLGRDDYDSSSRTYHGASGRRSESLTRGTTVVSPSPLSTPSRASLASQGRSLTQNEFGMRTTPKLSSYKKSIDGYSSSTAGDDEFALMRPGSYTPSNLSSVTSSKPSSRYSTNLEDRTRTDWRRTSVPERGKDFKSLPRKYNRTDTDKKPSY